MNAVAPTGLFNETPSGAARRRFLTREGRPLLLADWERALFMHFELPPEVLQRHVPFELDLFEGRAFMSLVAFTMRGMRLARGGRLGRWLCAPLGEQRFLNVRTYVRQDGEAGIHFLTEWISHALCVPFGPVTYGLPYRWGKHTFMHAHERGIVRGRVETRRGGGAMEYAAQPADGVRNWRFDIPAAGSLDEFFLERYAAFTQHGSKRRLFRIWHEPWRTAAAETELIDDSILRLHLPWWNEARLIGANYSPGAFNIWMGRPRTITSP
jgi:uncharacterized protein YqjF (DUF2071 family)